MNPKYLLIFRGILGEILLLQALYSPYPPLERLWPWALLALYASGAWAHFWLERSGRLAAGAFRWSFVWDVTVTTAVLHGTGGIAGEFYVAYFLVIFMSCLPQDLTHSLLVGAVSCLSYAGLANLHGIDVARDSAFLLRLALLMATCMFAAVLADGARRAASAAAGGYGRRLEWLERLSLAGRMASGILHELKTPLGAIILDAEHAKSAAPPGPAGSLLQAQLDAIIAEAERATAIVSDNLEFTRPSDLALSPVPLRPVVLEAYAKASLGTDPAAIKFEDRLTEATVVRGSRRHLLQVFINLLGNAIDAMPLGGRLSVSDRRAGEVVEITVSDTGLGISPEVLARLFEPFATTHLEGEGQGLGLYVTRWIVEKHGGTIRLESAGPKRGAAAVLTLLLQSP